MSLIIRYTHAPDRTRIAYAVTGSGPPLLYLPNILESHLQLAWDHEGNRAFLERLAQRWTLIQIDVRNYGMSKRHVKDCTQEALLSDVLAVLQAAQVLEPMGIWTSGSRSSVAIRLAVSHPELVRRMLFTFPAFIRAGRIPGWTDLAESNWPLFCEMMAQRLVVREHREQIQDVANVIRQCQYPEDVAAEFAAGDYERDYELAPQVACPVLVAWKPEISTNVYTSRHVEEFTALFPQGQVMRLARGAGPPRFGNPLPLEEVAYSFFGASDSGAPVRLSGREEQVLLQVCRGATNDEIGRSLNLSARTIERHLTNIYTKIGVRNRAEAVAWALKHRLD